MSLVVGIDVGTSAARSAAVASDGSLVALASAPIPPPIGDGRRLVQDPHLWWRAVESALDDLVGRIDPKQVKAFCVDGTSGTLLAVGRDGTPLAPARMYNDAGAV